MLPATGHAAILDWIYELSGPQLHGFVILHCEFSRAPRVDDPEDPFAPGKDKPRTDVELARLNRKVPCPNPFLISIPVRKWWWAVDSTVYLSGWKNSGVNEFSGLKVAMVAFDLTGGRKSKVWTRRGEGREEERVYAFLHHSGGLTGNLLYGENFGYLNKGGFKIQPLSLVFKVGNWAWDIAPTFRIYPDKYTAADFGFPSSPSPDDKDMEWTWGITWGVHR
jgi:hypothetical protein